MNGVNTRLLESRLLLIGQMDKAFETRQIGYVKELQEIFKPRFSIKFQFDMYHGIGNLDKAIELLPEKDKQDFSDYVRKKTEFGQGNMFISKSSNVINSYFTEVFTWLNKCEKILVLI